MFLCYFPKGSNNGVFLVIKILRKNTQNFVTHFSFFVTGKSLPVHCIVEGICSLEESIGWKRRPAVERDTYVIIPVSTPFQNIVHAALFRLGYPAESAAAARGSVWIKNWKSLSFDQISDDPVITVGDILGELSTVATLRIQLFRGKPGALAEIKDKLLRFLLLQSHGLLLSSGCPLDEVSYFLVNLYCFL